MAPDRDIAQLQRILDRLAASLIDLLNERGDALEIKDQHRIRAVTRGLLKRSEQLPRLVARGDRDWIAATEQFVSAVLRLLERVAD